MLRGWGMDVWIQRPAANSTAGSFLITADIADPFHFCRPPLPHLNFLNRRSPGQNRYRRAPGMGPLLWRHQMMDTVDPDEGSAQMILVFCGGGYPCWPDTQTPLSCFASVSRVSAAGSAVTQRTTPTLPAAEYQLPGCVALLHPVGEWF